MKKGQIIEGIVQRVDFPNKGVVATEEGVCIVKNALPGQKVRCAVNKVRKGRAEGRLLEVLAPAAGECGSPCPHFGVCGGCTYLSLPYGEQLRIKEGQVRKLLEGVLGQQDEWQFEGIKASPVCFGYRNKMEFSFGDEVKDGPLALGMHRRGSFYDIVSVTDCQIVDEDYRSILRCVRDYFAQLQEQGLEIRFYHRLRHTGYLRHLLVRKAAKTGEILIALVTTTQTDGFRFCGRPVLEEERQDGGALCSPAAAKGDSCEEDTRKRQEQVCADEDEILKGMTERLLQLQLTGKIVGILHTRNDAVADVVQSDETRLLYGQDFFYEELLGLKFKVSLFSFFQTNSLGAEVLYETARAYIAGYIGAGQEKEASRTGQACGAAGAEAVAHTAAASERGGEASRTGQACGAAGAEAVAHTAAASERGGETSQTGQTGGAAGAEDAAHMTDTSERRGKTVYDLYSGTGIIAQLMAPIADKVIGVEIVEEAVEAARQNATLNGLHNCEFIAGDVLKVLDDIEEKPDIIILDPPRDGIHPKALDKIIRYGVAHILYISCKPTSLVRDLEVLLARGYAVQRAVAVDQFPWTANVETVVLLTHKKPTSYIEVTMDYDKIIPEQKPGRATYKMITEYVKEKYNLVVKSTTIAEVKRLLGFEVGDYGVKEEKTNYRKEKVTPEKVNAIKDAMKYFGVIE